ncbi:MAG TPA: sulfite exporter TauE/SafE family protein [Solirubrobacteraceae bacterium]|nr:sulfite exporter TauE/SafE family protein [Solirubrobacteraceae bacterium]
MVAEHASAGAANRSLKLAAIGTAAGLFSGLFGVGGGSVIVPLLVLWLGYDERAATATSLAAIVLIAAFAAATQSVYGNVHVLDALLVGVPAVGGVLFGTWLHRRMHNRAISLMFAAVLVASAAELVLK